VRHDAQAALEIQQQVVARRDAAGEEKSRHPVIFVAPGAIHEAMRASSVSWLRMFEHLHGHDAVEGVAGMLAPVHVAGEHREIAQAAPPRLAVDVLPFCVRECETAVIRASG
jgi:hypothetical protein